MTLKLRLITAAALCLALPAVGLAAPPSDKGDQRDHQDRGAAGSQKGKGAKHDAPAAQVAVPGAAAASRGFPDKRTVRTDTGPAVKSNAGRFQAQTGAGVQGQGAGGHAASGDFGRRGAAPAVHAPTLPVPQVQAQRRVAPVQRQAPPALGDWNRTFRGADRDRAGQQWRSGHQGWDQSAPWRANPDWWRGNTSFRLFLGPRIGFFFIPELGYVSVPEQYRQHYWRPGDYLPNWFWRYSVRNYGRYGLPRPPDGCVWVWVDNDVALIDPSDGYILDIVHNAW